MRKATRRKHYNLVNPITHAISGAAITDTESLDKLRIRELSALEQFRVGQAGQQEWRDIADMLNISETMIAMGIGPESQEACIKVQAALTSAHMRYRTTGRMVLTGPELQSLRDLHEWHDLQRSSVSRSVYETAIRRTTDRIRSAHPSVKVCLA